MRDDYDIGSAFEAIEDELIASMMRNMKRHRAEELAEGYDWEMWQVLQLKTLEKYRAQNQKLYKPRFRAINQKIKDIIKKANEEGYLDEEVKILEAINKGFFAHKSSEALSGAFFRVNERKLNALIEATVNDMKTAETAILRMANDKYRKVIFNAQVYANSGAGTYEKAVDMATKDMLSAGLNCIQYANGARHTLSNYAKMAIRTASKRAYLQGEGVKRQEWGISTVIVNKRNGACPKCIPWVGRVLIDDVWSGGKASDSPYPLLSTAMQAGFYHPNCKDSHTTFFPGITEVDNRWTSRELEELGNNYALEQRQNYAIGQVKRFERLAVYSLDGDNRQRYRLRSEHWRRIVEAEQSYKSIRRGVRDTVRSSRLGELWVRSVEEYGDSVFISDSARIKPKALHQIVQNTKNALRAYKIPLEHMPKIVIVDSTEMLNALGMYDAKTNTVYYLPQVVNAGTTQIIYTELHEMWHLKQALEFKGKGFEITDASYAEYLRRLRIKCKKRIEKLGINEYNVGEISEYASQSYKSGLFDEVEAEWHTKKAMELLERR